MFRKAVADRLQRISKLRSNLEASRETVAHELDQRPKVLALANLTYGPVFAHLSAELGTVEEALRNAESTYKIEKNQLGNLRSRHKEASSALYTVQSRIKQLLEALLAPSAAWELAEIQGATPRQPFDLLRTARLTLEVLRRLEQTEPTPHQPVSIDANALAQPLRKAFDSLKTLDTELLQADAGVVDARCQADQAVDEVDSILPWVAHIAQGLHRLAGA